MNDQMNVRLEKTEKIREIGQHPYADRYERTHTIAEAVELPEGHGGVRLAGRVVALRKMGNLMFGHLFGYDGKIQFALQKKNLGDTFKDFKSVVDIGDFVGIEGEMIRTKTGEKTLNSTGWTFLSKALRPQPEKFHGLTDSELKLRRRYLELISNPDVMERFKTRSKVIQTIRSFLDAHDFVEIDTPVLTNKASGALARPFVTHNNALDIDVYLRIAPETYLKRAAAGGFERVYEFARSFRNEGVDASHLPDFTLLEYYASYWNYEDNMNFTEQLMKDLVNKITGSDTIEYDGREISFGGEWPRISFRDLILRDCGIDIYECLEREDILEAMEDKNIRLDDDIDIRNAGRGTLIDLLYKKVSRPSIIDPLFIIKHPLDLSPLARQSDDNEKETDRFQLVINGWEVINAYSELVDPLDQKERFRQQAAAKDAGDEDAMEVDEDFLTCMEYGMPPMSGWGMGIDRIVALLTNAKTLRDVVLFPLLRPEE
ncbi:lysyl-tRNA synthetase [Chitinivibrio alkaliphilus ACht1]|uniref:Lysine--tRNA ligase n=2 Tax=Chitinivibrio TaxID=1505231 RepID=U7D8G9_9BACT|nr:lysyl-tRNA synthetase [Chitinivibrio alkaliphilus ACht1]